MILFFTIDPTASDDFSTCTMYDIEIKLFSSEVKVREKR